MEAVIYEGGQGVIIVGIVISLIASFYIFLHPTGEDAKTVRGELLLSLIGILLTIITLISWLMDKLHLFGWGLAK
jgi:heme/copper-type cytochrome/quinol oxidase subunit 4